MDFSVGDIMQVNVQSVAPSMSLPDLEHELITAKVGGFPVTDDGKLVGVISRSDIVRQLDLERDVANTVSDFYFDESGFHEAAAISYQDTARRIGERIESLKVEDVMIQDVQTASPNWSLEQVARLFTQQHIHRLPVTEHGRLMGIVTTMDLTRLFADRRVDVKK